MKKSVTAGALIFVIVISGGFVILNSHAAESRKAASSVSNLTVSYRPSLSSRITFKVSCLDNAMTGSHPNKKAICATISKYGIQLFTPIPANTACTEIYGGPQSAWITGTVKGRKINSSFNRTNGCQIGRWDKTQAFFTFPGYSTVDGRIEVSPTCGGPVRPGQNCTNPSVAGKVIFNNKSYGTVQALALSDSGFSVLLRRGTWNLTGITRSAMSCYPSNVTVPTSGEIVLDCDTGIR